MQVNWWRCQIVNKPNFLQEFEKGDIIYGKNGEECIILFKGEKKVTLQKDAKKNIKLLSRLNRTQSAFIERLYQVKRVLKSSQQR